MLFYWILIVLLALPGETNGQITLPRASSCEDLVQILRHSEEDKRIIITDNMRCSRDQWTSTVYLGNHTIIEGSKFGNGVPAIDWADLTDAIVLQPDSSLTFQNVVLIQDFMHLYGLKLPFVSGATESSVHLLGTAVGIRSCDQSLDDLATAFRDVDRPSGSNGDQEISSRGSSTAFVENVAFYPPVGDSSIWAICNSLYKCSVNSPFQKDFQQAIHEEFLDPTCSGDDILTILGNSGSDVPSGSTSNATFAVLVAVFTAICTTLVLILLFVVFKVVMVPFIKEKKKKPTTVKEKALSDKGSPIGDDTPLSNMSPKSEQSRGNSTIGILESSMLLTDIELGMPLGKGTLSIVYKGYHNNNPLAVKVVDLEAAESVSLGEDPIATYFIQRFKHINVAETFLYQTQRMDEIPPETAMTPGGSILDSTMSSMNGSGCEEMFQYRTFHVMEFCNLGTLEKAMRDGTFIEAGSGPKMMTILKTALDIAKGMQYLHSLKIIHGQLRPTNVLLKGDALDARGFICKVSDFGMNHLQERQQAIEISNGRNLSYRAPEILRKGVVVAGSDVFSFGMILWSLLTGEQPLSSSSPDEIVSMILEGSRPEIPPEAPRRYERLIKDCWHQETSARPPFTNIIERLSKIISFALSSADSAASTPQHRGHSASENSSTDMDTILEMGGNATSESMLDTVEIHDTNSLSGEASPNGGSLFWEQFRGTTPASEARPSIDLSCELANTLEYMNTAWEVNGTLEPRSSSEQAMEEEVYIVSKPSETVSLRFGIASAASLGSDIDDLTSSDNSK